MALGLMLSAAPVAGFASNDSQSILSSGAKAVTATVSVDKGMVITNPQSGFDTLKVDVAVSGLTEGERSEFVVRLSDPAGSFEANTTEIARLVSDTGANVDTIVAWIVPDTVPEGDFYKVGVFAGTQDALSVETLMFRIKHEYAAEKQIPNSGFEVWMNEGETVAEPVGWHSFKTAGGGLSMMGGGPIARVFGCTSGFSRQQECQDKFEPDFRNSGKWKFDHRKNQHGVDDGGRYYG